MIGLFKQSNDTTKATISVIPGKYGHDTYHVELLTYFEERIAYVKKGVIISTYDDYGESITSVIDVYDDTNKLYGYGRRNVIALSGYIEGIDEIRFMDGDRPIEVFILTRRILKTVLGDEDMIKMKLLNTRFNIPIDICKTIIDMTEEMPGPIPWFPWNPWNTQIALDPEDPLWPFVIQSHNRGKKDADFRVVRRDKLKKSRKWKQMSY